MGRAAPFSIRLPANLDERLTAWARRAKRSKAAIAKELMDEAERCWRYQGIAFRGPENRRRAWLLGTGFDVWEMIWTLQNHDDDVETVLGAFDVRRSHIDLARTYYEEFPEEIDEFIAWTRRPVHELKAEFPFIKTPDEI